MDKLQAMQVFQSVADEGGFAAAARALDMSPAAVTRHISDLEADVGARLLQRTTRKVSLTDAGEAYLARVRHILVDVADARCVAQSHTVEIAGVVRISAGPLLATHVVAPAIAAFRLQHPRVTFDVSVEVTSPHGGSDFDIKLMSLSSDFNGNVIARPIITTSSILCASPEYLARRGAPRTPEELREHDVLWFKHPDRRSGELTLHTPDGQQARVRIDPVCQFNHVDTLLRAMLEGGGIGGQPVEWLAPYLNTGRLVRVLAPWTGSALTLYAMLPSRQFLPARTEAFLDFLTQRTRNAVRSAMERRA